MFLLKDLPDTPTLEKFKASYPQLNISSTKLFLYLLKIGSHLLTQLDRFLQAYELSHGRWITLILLYREDDYIALPSVLAEKQGITRATMSTLLKRLEKDGFVRRLPCGDDGRVFKCQLTSEGKSKLDVIMPAYYDWVSEMFDGIDETEKKALISFLTQLVPSD